MPKKKTTVKTTEVKEMFWNARELTGAKVGEAVASLVQTGKIERENASAVQSVITAIVNDSLTTIMANKDL